MSVSPTMSSRNSSVPPAKCPSSEAVCIKKEDRSRANYSGKSYNKQRQDTGNFPASSRPNTKFSNNGNRSYKPRDSRGGAGNWGGRRNQMIKNRQDEFNPVSTEIKQGKKVNLNHLLNFSYESMEDERGGGRSYRSHYMHKETFNKEQYLQANCQFIVKEGEDYSFYLGDSDLPMAWELIEKVNMWSSETPSCPICLYEPEVSCVTKCGHIYCWPCILHYLALDSKMSRICPICHVSVKKDDLKSVSVYKDVAHKSQSVITMKLMKRSRGSTVSIPVNQDVTNSKPMDYKFTSCAINTIQEQRNHKFLVGTSNDIADNIVRLEIEQLQFKLATETDETEKSFIQFALDLCRERLKLLEQTISDDQSTTTTTTTTNEFNNLNQNNESNVEVETEAKQQTQNYYFYQSNDGQHIYLHPINAKCISHQYGSFENCPTEITAKILELERFTMNESTRKRHRHLSHLSLSLEFHIAELDLRPPLVSTATLAFFREGLERKAAQRKKKARDEKRILRKTHNEEMRKQGKYPAARISLESQKQFPHVHISNPAPAPGGSFSVLLASPESSLSSYITSASSNECCEIRDTPSPISTVGSEENVSAGPSFAQMLRNTNDQPTWPRLASYACPPVATTSSSAPLMEVDADPNYIPPPSYQSSFGDALCSALDNLDAGSSEQGSKKKKKKSKGKKVLLFSTAKLRSFSKTEFKLKSSV
ncbi:E3 ubiquitin-protein ligase RNF10 isoform X2 [Ciona intestinalis]